MPLEIVNVVLGYYAAQYNGSNGADICAEFASTFDFDNGTIVRFLDGDSVQHDVTNGQWVVWIGTSFFAVLSSLPEEPYKQLVTVADLANVSLVHAVGTTSVPASLAGQTQSYNVNFSPAMPSTDYVYVAKLIGPPDVLSGHGILSHSIVDADTVSVSVQSGAASLSGASVEVTAWAVAS